MTEWINVNDKLPKQFRVVLVTDGKSAGLAYYCKKVSWLGTYGDGIDGYTEGIGVGFAYSILDVTHWMPLPRPPND